MGKIAFLGAGNMAAAIVEGLLAAGAVKADLVCLGGNGRTAAILAGKTGITVASSLNALITGADIIVVAFKPQHLATADAQLVQLTAGKLIVSVLAGKRLSSLSRIFPQARNIVRTMPNTPGQIGAGITGWCSLHPLSAEDRAALDAILAALGVNIEIDEAGMDALTAVSGSGPAYVFEFAAALRDAGIAAGLTPDIAQTLTVETLLGAARLLARKKIEPELLRNQVTSPNGVTFAGLQRMAARDFRGLIRETVLAAKARSKELSTDS